MRFNETPYVTYKDPVTVPQYDTMKENGVTVLRLPLGKDRKGRAYDFAIGIRKAKAILRFIDTIRDFVDRHDN